MRRKAGEIGFGEIEQKLCCSQLAGPIANVLEIEDHVATLSKRLAHMYIIGKVKLVGEHEVEERRSLAGAVTCWFADVLDPILLLHQLRKTR